MQEIKKENNGSDLCVASVLLSNIHDTLLEIGWDMDRTEPFYGELQDAEELLSKAMGLLNKYIMDKGIKIY